MMVLAEWRHPQVATKVATFGRPLPVPDTFGVQGGLMYQVVWEPGLEAYVALSLVVPMHGEGATPSESVEDLKTHLRWLQESLESNRDRLSEESARSLEVLKSISL